MGTPKPRADASSAMVPIDYDLFTAKTWQAEDAEIRNLASAKRYVNVLYLDKRVKMYVINLMELYDVLGTELFSDLGRMLQDLGITPDPEDEDEDGKKKEGYRVNSFKLSMRQLTAPTANRTVKQISQILALSFF